MCRTSVDCRGAVEKGGVFWGASVQLSDLTVSGPVGQTRKMLTGWINLPLFLHPNSKCARFCAEPDNSAKVMAALQIDTSHSHCHSPPNLHSPSPQAPRPRPLLSRRCCIGSTLFCHSRQVERRMARRHSSPQVIPSNFNPSIVLLKC